MKRSGRRGWPAAPEQNYFFTHLLEASSHFIVAIFSHAALVFGAPLAIAMRATAPKAMAREWRSQPSWSIPHFHFFRVAHAPGRKTAPHVCRRLTRRIRFRKVMEVALDAVLLAKIAR